MLPKISTAPRRERRAAAREKAKMYGIPFQACFTPIVARPVIPIRRNRTGNMSRQDQRWGQGLTGRRKAHKVLERLRELVAAARFQEGQARYQAALASGILIRSQVGGFKSADRRR